MQTPHDSLFRFVFSDPEHAKGELQHLLPLELSQRIDWSTLEKLPVSFVEEELSESRADVAFSVRFGGRDLVLCLLLEHQSTSDHWMAFRLLGYIVRLWGNYLKEHPSAKYLPAVVPMVVHHSRSGWTSPRKLSDLYGLDPELREILRPILPDFEYLLDDLSGEQSEELKRRTMTALGRLTLVCLGRSRQQTDLLPALEVCQNLLRKAGDAPGGVAALAAVVRYILHISETRPEGVQKLFEQMGPKVEEAFMTGAQILTQKARAEGEAKGEAKGKAEGKAEIVLKQLRLKFGALSAEQLAQVRSSSVDELERYAERVITVDTLDEILAR